MGLKIQEVHLITLIRYLFLNTLLEELKLQDTPPLMWCIIRCGIACLWLLSESGSHIKGAVGDLSVLQLHETLLL